MHLNHLILRNFRNYAKAQFDFSPSTNLIAGDNGRGKTNLLEAIYFISTGRSFRTYHLPDLIRHGESFFYIEAHFTRDAISQVVKIYYEEKIRRVQYNQTLYSTLTSLLGILPCVLLCPEDHFLVSGSPTERRRFLDIHIAQMDPFYVQHLARYFRAMKQRNHLLKAKSEPTLNAWEQMMAQSASYLIQKRRDAVEELKSPLGVWMNTLSLGKDALEMKYSPSITTTDLMDQWQKTRPKELHYGTTLIGPHRDELQIHISEKLAKDFSSEGQKRSCTASIRLAQWKQFKDQMRAPPLMGIDDFGLQLDQTRQKLLEEQLTSLGQVFLTSPKPLSFSPHKTIAI